MRFCEQLYIYDMRGGPQATKLVLGVDVRGGSGSVGTGGSQVARQHLCHMYGAV